MYEKQKGFTLIEGAIALGGVTILAVVVIAIYVVGHFITKYW